MTIPDTTFLFSYDSIFKSHSDSVAVTMRPSVFQGHELGRQSVGWIARHTDITPTWLFLVIMALVLMVYLFLRIHKIKPATLIGSALYDRQLSIMLRESQFNHNIPYLETSLLFSIALSLCIVQPLQRYGRLLILGGNLALTVLLLCVSIFLFLLVRHLLIGLLGKTFQQSDAVKLYLTNSHLYLLIDTLILIPFSLLLYYTPALNISVWTALAVVGFMLILRILRGAFMFFGHGSDTKIYLFYYLCTVEFVPLLVLTKLFILQ